MSAPLPWPSSPPGRPQHTGPVAGSADWLRLARLLSWLTLAWMGIEGGVAIAAAVIAGSVALLGFGLDSGIEALASVIVIWRFTGTRLSSATSERRAQQLVAVSFFLLAPYIAAEAIRALVTGDRAETSIVGLVLTAGTAVFEPALGIAKRRIGAQLGSPATAGEGTQNLLGTVTVSKSQVDGNTALNGGGISSGPGNGGAPGATSQLVVTKSEVDGNTAIAPVPQPGSMAGPPIAAGGIANGGNAVLNKTEVDNNTASFTSGAGIVNHGTMTLNKSEVNGNTAAGSGVLASGGGIISAQGQLGSVPTTLTLNNSVVKNNTAGGDGGGIANGIPLPGPMPLIGGALTLNHSKVTGNTAGILGGGIFNNGGPVTLTASSVTRNTPDNCEPTGTISGCTG